jgi:hypothetical protein
MKTKYSILNGLFTIVLIALLYWYDNSHTGEKYLGGLKHSCNEEVSINLYQYYRQSEWKQDVMYFQVKRGDSALYKKISFCSTSGEESLSDYSIHCHDSVLYVMIRSFSFPWIMFDTRSNDLYPNNADNEEEIKKRLFEMIKEGDPKLQID